MANKEDYAALALISGLTALPLVLGTPIPADDAIVALFIGIGAIVLVDTGSGNLSTPVGELKV